MNENHFESNSKEYLAHRPTYPPELTNKLASLCKRKEHALDVGCGTGQLSVALASFFDKVTATDSSKEQILTAKQHPNVTYKQEKAESLSLDSNSVDLIVAAQAAHWFDLDCFYQQVQRIGKEDSIIALVSYGVPSIKGCIEDRFKQFYWEDIHSYWPQERIHVEQHYESLYFPFENLEVPTTFIKKKWTQHEIIGYIETWSAFRIAVREGKRSIIDEFKADLNSCSTCENQTYEVSWPISGKFGKI